jgi:hypothetical protein
MPNLLPKRTVAALPIRHLLLVACAAFAQAAPAERPLSTDRPDTTESPYTVPTGRFQIEASLFDLSLDRRGSPGRFRQWVLGQINLKRGLTSDTDLQLILNSQSFTREVETGNHTARNEFGDTTLRLKQNLWGNDAGQTALALMPYLTMPTHSGPADRVWTAGLILPLALTLPSGWTLGLMSQLDVRSRAQPGSPRFQWLHSASTGIPITETLGCYLELVSIASGSALHQFSSNAGITCQITPSLVLDTGCRIGLSRSAPDLGLFSGFSIRF